MLDSRVPATLDALTALWTSAGAKTWDGPLVTGDFADSIFVGYDGDPEGDFATVEVDSEWAGIGARARDEEFDVVCAVVALVGENDTKLARDNAYVLLKLAADALRADPSLGQVPPFVASLKGGPVFTEPTESGYQVRIVFRVHVKTRI